MTFEDLQLINPILKALRKEQYNEPTPIQAQAIPLILQRHDVLGSAQTGTGKTAAFAIPIIQLLYNDREKTNRSNALKALVITPTRELAIQIGESFSAYGAFTQIRNTVVFGGVSQQLQTNALKKGIDVLIATPGRLLDLIDQGFINLKHIEYFVLDEADRMLDMGFIHDIKRIIALLPKHRQSLFFSATMPQNIVDLSRKILVTPKKIEVSAVSSTAETIQQSLYYTNKSNKNELLIYLLRDSKMDQVLLFSRTKHGADKIVKYLISKNITALAIHGDKAQTQRQKALNLFKNKKICVLVATDIAARGIDIDKLKYVINYDIPNIPETYVHRIGRSGRAGDIGMAFSLCEPEENASIKDIEKLIQLQIPVVANHPFPQTDKIMNAQEKKAFEKEKILRKQAFFANRNNRGF
jgi:ATP-dependent RNA helicase RhlE